MATSEQLAAWIVKNQDKKGTHEFETVSASYKAKRAETAQLTQATDSQSALKETLGKAGWAERNLAGAGAALAKTYYGGKQLLKGGTLSPEDQQAIKDWTTIEQEAPVGAIAGNVGMFAALPSSTLPKLMASGAGYMAAQPTEKQGIEGLEQRIIEGGKGAALSAAGYGVAKGIGRALNPQTSPEALALAKEGVTLTPGQIMGGAPKKAEEAARSIPILGDMITRAQRKGIEQFNRAAINRALNPIGKGIDKNAPVGYKAIQDAHSTISQAYDDLLPKLKIATDKAFISDINNLRSMAVNMHPQRAEQFNQILNNSVLSKFTQQGKIHPTTFKEVDSQIGQIAAKGLKSQDLDQQQLGAALREVQRALRDTVQRANPKHAGELGKINTAYANLLRVENAAARTGASEGIFTPSQLKSATRSLDASLRKRATAHGKALMQDLATSGDAVMTNRLPDSGTATRAIYGLGALATGAVNPAIPAGLFGGAGLYTQPAQKTLASLLMERPDLLRKAGQGVSSLAPYAGMGAVGAGQ